MATAPTLKVRISADPRELVEQFARSKRALKDLEAGFRQSTAAVAAAARQVRAHPGDAALAREFERLKTAAAAAKREFVGQQIETERLRRALAAQGVSVANLAADWRRLKAAQASAATREAGDTAAAAAAARQMQAVDRRRERLAAARQIIGIDGADTEAEIRRVQAALGRLKTEGGLAGESLARAALSAKTRIAELRAETGGLVSSLGRVKEQAALAFAPFAAVGALAVAGARDFMALGRRLSEIGTLTGATRQEMGAFGAGVRRVSQQMGRDAGELAAAAYNVISAGVDQGQALAVVALSARAATAGVANVNDTARLGLAVLNSYGLSVEHLERVFDVLFATVRGGVTTIPELAGSLARVLPTARAAGVPFEELAAALATLTRAFGGQTAEAVTALNSAIVQLAAPTDEARRHMAELGIEWNGLIGTIRQIGERNLGLAAVRQIIPDIEGAKAVMTLAGNYEQLAQRLRETDQAAGAMQTAFEFVAEDDAAAVERLGAAWAELLRALGETLAVFTPVLDALAGLLRGFNELHPLVRGAAVFLAAFALAWRPLKVVVDLVVTSLRAFPGAFAGFRAGGLASLASVKSAFALFYAAVAGWSIGSYLRQEFAAAERAGVALVAGLLKGWARIEYAWARIQAIFRGGAARARAELEAQLRDVDDWATERFIEIARRGRHAAEAGRLPAPAVAPGTGESEAAGQRRDAELERRRRDAELQRERDAAQRLADAQRDLVATLADQADRLSAETIAREIERNREAWDARTISAEQYYARLTELQRQQVELELQALARRRQGAAVDEAGARARGDEPAALAAQGVIARIDTDIELARRRLAELQREAGVGLAAAQTARLRDQAQALASQIDAQFAALARREEQLRNQVELGLPQRAAEAQVNAARRETLGITAALVAQLEELVALQPELFGPDMLERIERFRTGLGQIGVVADSVAVRINDALGQSLERLFADIAQGTATLGDALRGFLRSIVAAINQQLSRELAQGIMRAFDASGGAQGGAGGLGGWISGLLRSWFDGGDGFARGGYTGPGHRLQPAGVVHAGEYVFPADAVRRLGVQSLAALHRFASGAFVPLGPRLSYADGGAVQLPAAAAGAAPQSIRIVNTVDPELARDYLESAAGERVIVNAITRNAGAVRMMLQG